MKPVVPFQFHLRTLFITVTVAAIIFALMSYWGIGGAFERVIGVLSFAAIFSPLYELHQWWRDNVEIFRGEERK